VGLHNDEICNVFSLPNIRVVKRTRWISHVAKHGGIAEVYTVLAGKPEGTRPIGRLMDQQHYIDLNPGGGDDGTCVGYINLVQNGNWQTLVKREEPADPVTS
jgi:hypothetical protein